MTFIFKRTSVLARSWKMGFKQPPLLRAWNESFDDLEIFINIYKKKLKGGQLS